MKKVLILFAVWLAVLSLVGIVSRPMAPWQGKSCDVKNASPYFRWDSSWYTGIAEKGYTFSLEKNSSIAYFPLYPLLMKVVHVVVPLRLATLGLILNVLCVLLTLWLLYRIAQREGRSADEGFAIAAVWLLFPASYFLLSGYPDALFACLTALTLFFLVQQKWYKAGLSAALLTLTKPYGFLIAPIVVLEYWRSNGWDIRSLFQVRYWPVFVAPLLALGGFAWYNALKFGHPLAFLLAQRTWGRTYDNPLRALLAEAHENLFSADRILTGSHAPYVVYLGSALFFCGALFLSWSRVNKNFLLFSILVLGVALCSGTLTSFGRYMFLTFPVLAGPALVLARKKTWLFGYLAVSSVVLVVLAHFFVRCYPFE